MNTITLEIETKRRTRRIEYSIPSTPAELSAKQLRMIAQVITKDADPTEKQMEILMRLGRITRPDVIQGEHILECMKLLDFLDDTTFELAAPIIKWVGPFKSPKKKMARFTGGQMALCDTILQAIQSQDSAPDKLLTDFCAANFTLMGIPWRDSIANWVAIPFFKHFVRRSTKLAIVLQYRAMRRIFSTKYENAFQSSNTFERFPSLGWDGTIVRLAGDKFGTPERVRRTPAHELFTYLEQNKRDEIRNSK